MVGSAIWWLINQFMWLQVVVADTFIFRNNFQSFAFLFVYSYVEPNSPQFYDQSGN